MAAQTISETEHISRERFLRRLQWLRSNSRQGTIRAALLRSRNWSLAMERSPWGKVGRLVTSELKMGCCMVALASLRTEQPLEMICPATPGGTVQTPRSSLRQSVSSWVTRHHLLHTDNSTRVSRGHHQHQSHLENI